MTFLICLGAGIVLLLIWAVRVDRRSRRMSRSGPYVPTTSQDTSPAISQQQTNTIRGMGGRGL